MNMLPQMMHVSSQPGHMTEGAAHSFPVAFPPMMYMPQPDENFFFQNQQLLQNSMAFHTHMPQVNNSAPVQVNNPQLIMAQSPETVPQTPLQTEGQLLKTENEVKVEETLTSVPQMQVPQIQPAQFVQPMVFPQGPMGQQQMPHFVPCVVPGGHYQPSAFQPMMFVQQPNLVMFNQPEQHPISISMRSDSSHSRHESFDGSELSDMKSNSLRRFSSDHSNKDGYGSDYWDNRSRIGSEQHEDEGPPYHQEPNNDQETKNFDGSQSHSSQGNYNNKRYYKPRENQYKGRERSQSRSGSQNRPTSRERQEEMYKTELCSAWVNQRKCRFGHRCIFAHGLHEIRTAKRKQTRQKMRPALKKYVTAMLNKLTEANFDEISTEFLTVCVEEVGEQNLNKDGTAIMKTYFNKAVAHKELRESLAECLTKLFKVHPNRDAFREAMSTACYTEYCKPRNKTFGLGTMEWMAMLITKDLINEQIVHRILEQMKDAQPEQLKVELWCKILELMGNRIDSTEYFEELIKFKTISTRVRYMIMDLEDLKKNNWVMRM